MLFLLVHKRNIASPTITNVIASYFLYRHYSILLNPYTVYLATKYTKSKNIKPYIDLYHQYKSPIIQPSDDINTIISKLNLSFYCYLNVRKKFTTLLIKTIPLNTGLTEYKSIYQEAIYQLNHNDIKDITWYPSKRTTQTYLILTLNKPYDMPPVITTFQFDKNNIYL